MSLRVLSASDVRLALPMSEAISGMKQAFAQLSAGQAQMPLRSRIENQHGTLLLMPVYLEQADSLAMKLVTVFPNNRDLPIVQAMVMVVNPHTGAIEALLEGSTLTAIRTGAGAGAATDLLARHDARTVAIIGSGVQARTQLEAVCHVRGIEQVYVYSPTRTHAERFADDLRGRAPIPENIIVTETANEAVRHADIVCTATTSITPYFEGRVLKTGAHVNAVGSYMPTMQEVDSETVARALVVVDSRQSVLAEAGDLVIPLERGEITLEHLHAELGEIVSGTKEGRTHADQLTYFKSCGVAVQDAIAATLALKNAERLGLGQVIPL